MTCRTDSHFVVFFVAAKGEQREEQIVSFVNEFLVMLFPAWSCDFVIPPIETKNGILQVKPTRYTSSGYHWSSDLRDRIADFLLRKYPKSLLRAKLRKAIYWHDFDFALADGKRVEYISEIKYRTVYLILRPKATR